MRSAQSPYSVWSGVYLYLGLPEPPADRCSVLHTFFVVNRPSRSTSRKYPKGMEKQTYQDPELIVIELSTENCTMQFQSPGEGGSGDPFPGLDG